MLRFFLMDWSIISTPIYSIFIVDKKKYMFYFFQTYLLPKFQTYYYFLK